MIRLARCVLLAPRALVPATRPRPLPLVISPLPSLTSHRHTFTARARVNPPTPPVTLTRRRQLQPLMKTRESVMREFENVTSQVRPGSSLSSAGYEVIKTCVSPYLLEPPATKVAMATEMISILKEKGVTVDVGVYNTLLRVYLSLGHTFTPSQLLTEMQESGVEPNVGTLTYLIEAYCQQGNLTGAAKLLEHLSSSESAVTEDIYASLITGHAQKGDLAEAEGVVKMMRDKGHPPGNTVYQALRCAYAQHGITEGLDKVREVMRRDKVYASTASTVRVMDTLSRYNHTHLIQDVLDSIRKKEWMLEDLRALACTLLMRGEVEGGLVVVRCLGAYSAVTTPVGCAVVRGMALARQPLEEIFDLIGQLPAMSSNTEPINMWVVYRELLGMIFEKKLSTDDQRAKDIVTVAMAMKNIGGGGWFVDKSFLYPVLAHYAEGGNIEGCVETLRVMGTVANHQYDFVSMRFLDRTLFNAKVSPADFFRDHLVNEDQSRPSRLVTNFLVHLCETGNFPSLSQSLRLLSSSEGANVGLLLRALSLALKKNYKTGSLPDIAEVYLALHDLQPRPPLDISIAMATRDIITHGQASDRDALYDVLLSPLTKAGVNVGEAHSELLTCLAQRDRIPQYLKVYKEVEHLPLSPSLHEYATMVSQESQESLPRRSADRLKTFVENKPLPLDLARYDGLMAREEGGLVGGANMPQYIHCEELLLSLVNSDLKTALRIRDDMVRHGYNLRFAVYEAFTLYYARQGDIQSMLAEVESLEKSGRSPNSTIYTNMMLGYSQHGEWEEVCRLLEQVKERHRVDGGMTAYLIHAYLNSDHLLEALQVLSEYTGFAAPRPHALKALLNELIKQGRPQAEVGVVIDALRSTPVLTADSITDIVLWVFLNNNRMSDAREIVEKEDFVLKGGMVVKHCRQWKAAGRTDLVRGVVNMLRDAGLHRQSAKNAHAILLLHQLLQDSDGAQSLSEDLHDNRLQSYIDRRFTTTLRAVRQPDSEDQ